MARTTAADHRTILAAAAEYPAGLRDLADPPPMLHARGLPLPGIGGAVAIVGARAATRYGLDVAHRLAADLARLGFTIVSGLARGIDAAAHEGALDAGGHTVAVLPGGLDTITPPSHAPLAERIRASGALVTERRVGTTVYRGSFLERNRLIAALSSATVVVEAAARSGALVTARVAMRLGRPVLAVPGDIDRETSRGCHQLLREGASVCEGANDVLARLDRGVMMRAEGPRRARSSPGIVPGDNPWRAQNPPTVSAESRVLAALTREARLVEDIARHTALDVAETLTALLALQWAGLARPVPGQRWTRA